jgi:hypothetical protein
MFLVKKHTSRLQQCYVTHFQIATTTSEHQHQRAMQKLVRRVHADMEQKSRVLQLAAHTQHKNNARKATESCIHKQHNNASRVLYLILDGHRPSQTITQTPGVREYRSSSAGTQPGPARAHYNRHKGRPPQQKTRERAHGGTPPAKPRSGEVRAAGEKLRYLWQRSFAGLETSTRPTLDVCLIFATADPSRNC